MMVTPLLLTLALHPALASYNYSIRIGRTSLLSSVTWVEIFDFLFQSSITYFWASFIIIVILSCSFLNTTMQYAFMIIWSSWPIGDMHFIPDNVWGWKQLWWSLSSHPLGQLIAKSWLDIQVITFMFSFDIWTFSASVIKLYLYCCVRGNTIIKHIHAPCNISLLSSSWWIIMMQLAVFQQSQL